MEQETLSVAEKKVLDGAEYKVLQRMVKEQLKLYRALNVRLQNKRECEAAGVGRLFPSIRENYIKDDLKVKQIDRALTEGLDAVEREIIELKYLQPSIPTDLQVYMDMYLEKTIYYQKKKSAVISIAYALGMI
ncbi:MULTISPECIES: ArpU family phage packaging/lysis transcriptional regulator [Peribacillus]|uniref:ArpU family phage packaging/lysis transcriptional regulator n=1 Tax=Peribacillus TaxID=2675229 RepID=UPI001F4EF3E9|nr:MULTISPECIES: ArpU family phage packaging/lysis transcriptional regulator [unclassified Peribacillus]MCK1986260.1 ArpU family transcriptional regulator [Peribacillus sp. Aquil_B1]MCK2010383.1 ArpU family transcriptional regulator [Peribacillus sp. Aquil_B8]